MDQIVLPNFIVLEGLDGAGTTTQLTMLNGKLADGGVAHFCTCEPTRGPIGRMIRAALRKDLDVRPHTMALLFAADRSEHVEAPGEGIRERALANEIVISDRYLFSSLAYQGLDCGFDYVWQLNSRFPLPGYLFFIDTPVWLCQMRIRDRESADLFDSSDFQEKVRRRYLEAFERFAGSSMDVRIVDGTKSAAEIFETLWRLLEKHPIMGK